MVTEHLGRCVVCPRSSGDTICADRQGDVFRPVVEDELGLDLPHLAMTNLAKCRQDPDFPAHKLTNFCVRDFRPAALVEALRPTAVIVCVISADPSRGMQWATASWEPLVFACEGRNSCDIQGRGITVWAPEAAERIRKRWAELDQAAA